MSNNNKIQIAVLEISSQNKAVLEFYFGGPGKDFYTLVDHDKADAFITDYDYPGARDSLDQILKTTKKPAVVLSVREQNIPLTLWLSKPLSAAALTKAANGLRQIIKANKENAAEALLAESQQIEETPEATVVNSTEEDDFFDMLPEEELDENQNEVAELAVAKTEHSTLAKNTSTSQSSAHISIDTNKFGDESTFLQDSTNDKSDYVELNLADESDIDSLLSEVNETDNEDSFDESDNDNNSHKADINSDEIPNLAFTDVVIESQNTNDSGQTDDESEVDALLESLISCGGRNSQQNTDSTEDNKSVDNDTSDDISTDSSLLDFELNDAGSKDSDEEQILNSTDFSAMADGTFIGEDFAFEEPKSNDASEQNNADNSNDTTDVSDISEKNVFEDDVVEDDLLIQENFTLHDDLEPSTENAYDDSIDIDYSDLKTDESHQFTSAMEATLDDDFDVAGSDSSTTELDLSTDLSGENDKQNDDIEATLDNDLFDFELEGDSVSEIAIADNTISDTDTENSAEFDISDETKQPFLSLVDDKNTHTATDIDKTDNDSIGDYDLDMEMDLDNLLKEVSGKSDKLEISDLDAEQQQDNEALPIINDTATIKVDFNEPVDELSNDLDDGLINDLDNGLVEGFDDVLDDNQDDDPLSENSPDFELQSLLNEIRDEADKNSKNNSAGYLALNANGPDLSESAYEQTKAEKRWSRLCGNVSEIKEQKEVAKISFNLNNHLLGTLLRQISSTKNSEQVFRLKLNELIIVIDSSKNSIYCNLPVTSDDYAVVCFIELNPLKIKVHDLDYSEVSSYRKKIKDNPDRAHTIESFVWTTSLLTSQGRLPHDANITKDIGLKVWPNLTRLELMPHAMHMAAVFSKHPGSLLDIAKWLNIHQRYVFAFYNACLSLNMIELDASKMKKSSFSFGKKGSEKKSEDRGFFGRLLKRLKS